MIFDNFPYTNFHEMNLDWILHKVKEMDSKLDNFVDLNAVKYHDPIGWDITTQYAQNEIVKDPNTGILYMAKQPVPQGIALTNGDYWLEIGDMSYNIDFLKQAIAVPDEGTAVISANAYNAGDVIWWQDELYQVIVDIAIGDSFVINTNIKKITLGEQITQLEAGQADLEQTIETDLADLEQELAFRQFPKREQGIILRLINSQCITANRKQGCNGQQYWRYLYTVRIERLNGRKIHFTTYRVSTPYQDG